jgi:hypothetical protein
MALRKPLFMASEGYSEEMALTDSAQFSSVTITGAPVAGTDATNKAYVDARISGLDWKESVRLATAAVLPANTAAGSGVGKTLTANANGVLTVDGVATVLGDRLLIKDEATGANRGIYVVTTEGTAGVPFVLTRAADADSNAELTPNAAVFVEEGAVNADTGWVLTTDAPIVVDTTSLTFAQFSSTTSVIYGAGLINNSGTVDVELHTAANAQGAGTAGGSSGLEFDAAGGTGKLRAAVNATAGLQRTGSGLGVLLNGTTLQSSASGVSVKGVPSLFEVNAVAVGANVTAANLDTLVNAGSADALHFHGTNKFLVPVNEAVAIADPLVAGGVADRVIKGRADTDSKAYVLGIAETGQGTVGNDTRMVRNGVATGVLSGASVGQRFYLAATGGLSTANSPPGSGNRVILVGIAKNATDLWMNIIDFGKKAA